jgi:hypothetical protein
MTLQQHPITGHPVRTPAFRVVLDTFGQLSRDEQRDALAWMEFEYRTSDAVAESKAMGWAAPGSDEGEHGET